MLTLSQMNPQQITTALSSGHTLGAPPPHLETPTINWEAEYAERHGLPVRRVAEEVGDEDDTDDIVMHEHHTLADDPALALNADDVPHLVSPTINWEEELRVRRGRVAGSHTKEVDGPSTNNEAGVPHLVSPAIDWQAEYRARRK